MKKLDAVTPTLESTYKVEDAAYNAEKESEAKEGMKSGAKGKKAKKGKGKGSPGPHNAGKSTEFGGAASRPRARKFTGENF